MLPWETMTVKALWQTVATMPPSWFTPSMPQWETISRRSSMTNRLTHSTNNEPFHLCYKWQNISPMLPITNCCTSVIYDKPPDPYMLPWEATAIMPPLQTISAKPSMITISPIPPMTNHLTKATYDKLFYLLPSIANYFPHSTHEKNIRPMSPWQTIATMLPPETLSPIESMTNHFTHSTMANYFDDATLDKPFQIFSPWIPWVLFHQDKLFHPWYPSQTISPIQSMTYHLSVN